MREGALPGFTAFDPGSAFVGLLVGCVFVFIIDNNWKNASITNAAALALTGIGMIHSPGILGTAAYAPDMGFVQVYIVLMIVSVSYTHLCRQQESFYGPLRCSRWDTPPWGF